MGSYGIGPGEVMGCDCRGICRQQGLVWPLPVAPFSAHVLSLQQEDAAVSAAADTLTASLKKWTRRSPPPGLDLLSLSVRRKAGAAGHAVGFSSGCPFSSRAAISRPRDRRESLAHGRPGVMPQDSAISS